MKRLLIRADGNLQIGYGHVMRCLALAQEWRETRGPVTFVMADPPADLRSRVQHERMDVTALGVPPYGDDDAGLTAGEAERHQAAWIVLDGYRFLPSYQQQLRERRPLLMFDDEARAPQICADIVLNQNLSAAAADYDGRAPGARLLLGCEYALLRREFLERGEREIAERPRRLLITLGGSDPENATGAVLRELRHIEGLEIRAIAGGGHQHADELQAEASCMSSATEVLKNVDNMRAQMAWAEMAISAAGSTCWEMAYMGLPALMLVLSRDQEQIAAALQERGVSIDLGRHQEGVARLPGELASLLADRERRQRMSVQGRQLVDGKGAARVVAAMEELR